MYVWCITCATESGRVSCCIIRVHLVSKSYRSLLVINNMANSLTCCVFLMLTVFATLSKAAEFISKSACNGDSVLIFQNITSARFNKTITLYKNSAEKNETMAFWLRKDSNVEIKTLEKFISKVSFANGSISLLNIESTDEATYILLYDTYTSTKIETNILVLDPPPNTCKPKMRQDNTVLFAFLENSTYCGTAQVSVQWMAYPGICYKESKAVIEVPSGNNASTYMACIEGKALMCIPKSAEREYCKEFTIQPIQIESTAKPSCDTCDKQQVQTFTIVAATLGTLILIVVIVYIVWKCFRSRRNDSGQPRIDPPSPKNRNVTNPQPGHVDPLSQMPLLQENIEMPERRQQGK